MVTFITACTNRKRVGSSLYLSGKSLLNGEQSVVSSNWLKKLKSAKKDESLYKAETVYCGRGFSEARKGSGNERLLVVSAGLGLIEKETLIPGYSITVSTVGDDSVVQKVDSFSATHWWQILSSSPFSMGTLRDEVQKSKGVFVIALPRNYLSMVEADLSRLSPTDKKRLRIINVSREVVLPSLLECLIPIDDRLDGPDSPLPGTKSDLVQRAARFFIDEVVSKSPRGSVRSHKAALSSLLEGWRKPKVHNRKRLTDEEIKLQILSSWEEVGGRSGAMLRHFRDHLGMACEQSRFKSLFNEVAPVQRGSR
jgi:hypothetical protein